jgi:hypothetical protein
VRAGNKSHLMPVERVLFALVDVEFLDVVAVPDGAQPADVRRRDGVGMHGGDEESVIGDIAIGDVARAEVVRDADSELMRRDDDPPGRSFFARGSFRSRGCRSRRFARRLAGRGGLGGFGGSRGSSSRGGGGRGWQWSRLDDFENASDQVRLAVSVVPRRRYVDVV